MPTACIPERITKWCSLQSQNAIECRDAARARVEALRLRVDLGVVRVDQERASLPWHLLYAICRAHCSVLCPIVRWHFGRESARKKQESEVDFGCPELCEELKNAETEYDTADRNHKVRQHTPPPTAHAHARSAHTHCIVLYAALPLRQTAPLFLQVTAAVLQRIESLFEPILQWRHANPPSPVGTTRLSLHSSRCRHKRVLSVDRLQLRL